MDVVAKKSTGGAHAKRGDVTRSAPHKIHWEEMVIWVNSGDVPSKKKGTGVLVDFPRKVNAMRALDRIDLVKLGVPVRALDAVAVAIDKSVPETCRMLGVAATTKARKMRTNENLAPDQGERVMQLVRLIGHVDALLAEYGDPDKIKSFEKAKWLGDWLESPQSFINGRKPSELMDSSTGQELVRELLTRTFEGSFA